MITQKDFRLAVAFLLLALGHAMNHGLIISYGVLWMIWAAWFTEQSENNP